jgi:hypothetical protein
MLKDPDTGKEHQMASLVSAQMVQTGPQLELNGPARPISGRSFTFRQISQGDVHPVDLKFEPGKIYRAVKWHMDDENLCIDEYEEAR